MRWALFLASVLAFADTLTLKNGRVISGSYPGGTTTAIRFAVGDQVQTIPTTDIERLTFDNNAVSCSNAKVAVDAWEGGSQRKKMSLTGSKRWLVYTQLCSGIQNGNLGYNHFDAKAEDFVCLWLQPSRFYRPWCAGRHWHCGQSSRTKPDHALILRHGWVGDFG